MSASPFSGQQQVYKHSGAYWTASVTLKRMTRAEAEYWICFFLKLNGRYGTFLMGDPAGATGRGTLGGTPLANGAQAAGSQSLVTDGWTAGATILAGDYLQAGSGTTSRLYKNLSDVTANGSGQATLDVFPPLREALADNAAITKANAVGTWRLADNEMPFSIDEAKLYEMSFDCIEAI
jgi:hypothetical protein